MKPLEPVKPEGEFRVTRSIHGRDKTAVVSLQKQLNPPPQISLERHVGGSEGWYIKRLF